MRIIFLLLFLLLSFALFSQKPPAKFGDIPMEDMKMTVYPLDSSAAAVVLFDYGVYDIFSGFTRHTRIKILKKEGMNLANIEAVISAKSKLSIVKASTFNLENDEIVETKLTDKGVFNQKFNKDFKISKFTMPQVRQGSIIEYTYNAESGPLNWKFQSMVPARLSEYWAILPNGLTISKYMQGYLTLSSYKTIKNNHHWIMKDIPAFKKEPYMTSEEDYISKVNIVFDSYVSLSAYSSLVIDFMATWEEMNKRLSSSDYFGKLISGSGFLKEKALQVTDSIQDPLSKVMTLSNYVKRNFEWDGYSEYWGSFLRKIVDAKKGSSGELNLLFASMLEKLGFEVEMVLLSTRDHGFIRKQYPSPSQLNYAVCSIKINDKTYLLDVTDKYLPWDVLPGRCINGQGLVISKKNFGWIDITSKAKEKTYVSADFNLSEAGMLDGKINYTFDGYDAQTFRKDYYSKGDEAFMKSFLSNKQWQVVKSEFKNMDQTEKSAKALYEIKIDEHATSAGDVIYINPIVTSRIEENPFKSEKREYPVDYGNKIERTYNCKLTIPEGFIIEELPKSQVLGLPENAARYTYNVVQVGNSINITSIFQINKTLFIQNEYPHLREFYNQVIAKQTQQIVLKKK